MCNSVYAQTEAPYVQWQYTGEATIGAPEGEDWIYDIIETSDGGFLSVGFSDIIKDEHLPSFIKLDANGNHLWDVIVSMGEPTYQGNFQVVKELDNGHFVMFGSKHNGTSDNLILHEIDASGIPEADAYLTRLNLDGTTNWEQRLTKANRKFCCCKVKPRLSSVQLYNTLYYGKYRMGDPETHKARCNCRNGSYFNNKRRGVF